ncbi:unnamed protein product [Heterobilharzia americana]|nr:unnamed protein product [Heterobilharzia americana]
MLQCSLDKTCFKAYSRPAYSGDTFVSGFFVMLHHSGCTKMSSLTLDCTTVFSNSVDYTCETISACIKSTYVLMAKCEELSRSMSQLEPLKKEVAVEFFIYLGRM